MTNSDFTFYSHAEYYDDLVARISEAKAGDRVALATMAFEPDQPEVQKVLDALGAAAERGIRTSLAIDAYNFLSSDQRFPGPLFFYHKLPKRMPAEFRFKLHRLRTLHAQGVRYAITNKPSHVLTSPVAGRSHLKFAIINQRVYVGGCNLSSAKRIDMMLGWNDAKTADWLYAFANDMVDAESTDFMQHIDRNFAVDAQSELLVDSGKRKQSIIFEHALCLIDQAEKEVLITCQYFPNSVTTRHLIAAYERGVRVKVIYNHPSKFPKPLNLLHHMVIARERTRTPAILFEQQLPKHGHYLHAKIIATDKSAIIGSHNYVTAGVNFGTAEIALMRHNPDFSCNIIQALDQQLISNKKSSLP